MCSRASHLRPQNELDAPHDPSSTAATLLSHISNVGRMVEDMEGKMRSSLQEVYFSSESVLPFSLALALGFEPLGNRARLLTTGSSQKPRTSLRLFARPSVTQKATSIARCRASSLDC